MLLLRFSRLSHHPVFECQSKVVVYSLSLFLFLPLLCGGDGWSIYFRNFFSCCESCGGCLGTSKKKNRKRRLFFFFLSKYGLVSIEKSISLIISWYALVSFSLVFPFVSLLYFFLIFPIIIVLFTTISWSPNGLCFRRYVRTDACCGGSCFFRSPLSGFLYSQLSILLLL